MPAMANITVKNAANVDVVYVGVSPSAGDRSPARWQANAASPVIGFRPNLQVVTRNNGNNTGRHFEAVFRGPIVETIEGRLVVTGTVPFTLSGTIPTQLTADTVADLTVQMVNLFSSSLFKQMLAEGYAAT